MSAMITEKSPLCFCESRCLQLVQQTVDPVSGCIQGFFPDANAFETFCYFLVITFLRQPDHFRDKEPPNQFVKGFPIEVKYILISVDTQELTGRLVPKKVFHGI